MLEYSYSPKANIKANTAMAAAGLLSSALFFAASFSFDVLSNVSRALGSMFFLLFMLVSVRYVGTGFMYRVTYDRALNGDLTMYRQRGYFGKYRTVKQSAAVCRVYLSDIEECLIPENKKERRNCRRRVRSARAVTYNYCVEPFPKKYAFLKITDGERTVYVKFSPDERLAELIKSAIEK